ncbi:MAG: sulfide:quinone reductase [Deltaproteobacteria bacterium]|nr:MAG: sulfide:quinone reductase [Deltaproteobacteria bacterium]
MTQALVLGGGFAGVESAIFLSQQRIKTTLVSDRDYVWVYPTSIWVTVGADPSTCKVSLAELAEVHGFDLIVDPVVSIEPEAGRVELESQTLSYEYLVLATGASKLKPPGVEHTLSICGSPTQTSEIYQRLGELVAAGGGRIGFGFGGNPKDKSAVRGGPVFEVMFNVHHWLKTRGMRDKFELTFFAPMPEPGKRMGEKALEVMDRLFARTGIGRKVGTKISGFSDEGVEFVDGTVLETDLTIFVAAGTGHPVIVDSGLPLNEAGFVVIDEQCRVEGQERIWAVGDVAALEGPEFRAKQGHVAEVMARIAAMDIGKIQQTNGESRHDESYIPHVNILCLMDTGNGGAMVKRTTDEASVTSLPVVGHWMKKGWGKYWRLSKLKKIPRLPGM